MAPIVTAESLGKRYQLGEHTPGYGRLTESLSSLVGRRRGTSGADSQFVWALRDASFSIEAGEVVGLIGRNGAGKSTLLKLLARVTAPTEGRAEIRGRVGSLLEVGTGFHQELTGRENVFLSGAILGMRRTEIQQKFDEIVAFAEVEQFLDTQVKRYSSGMALRLGFAVAAYLEPEVLLVDEVLAVGDMKFREKCMGRIGEVSREDGRTVLFVSHDLNAVLSTCSRALLVEHGRLVRDGPVDEVVTAYEERRSSAAGADGDYVRGAGNPRYPAPVFTRVRIEPLSRDAQTAHGDALRLTAWTSPDTEVSRFSVDIVVRDQRQRPVAYVSSARMQGLYAGAGEIVECTIPFLPLAPGHYQVQLLAEIPGVGPIDSWADEVTFDVVRFDPFDVGSVWTPTHETGHVVPEHRWSTRPLDQG